MFEEGDTKYVMVRKWRIPTGMKSCGVSGADRLAVFES